MLRRSHMRRENDKRRIKKVSVSEQVRRGYVRDMQMSLHVRR
jgi:hypothetical protein